MEQFHYMQWSLAPTLYSTKRDRCRCWMLGVAEKGQKFLTLTSFTWWLRISVIYKTKSAWVTIVLSHFSIAISIYFSFKAKKRGWKQITAEIVAAKRTFVSIWKIGAAQQQRWQRTWSEIGSANNDDGDGDEVVVVADDDVVDDDGDDGKARWEAEEGGLVRKTGTPSPPLPNGCQQTTKFSSHDESRSQTKKSSQNRNFSANKRWDKHSTHTSTSKSTRFWWGW